MEAKKREKRDVWSKNYGFEYMFQGGGGPERRGEAIEKTRGGKDKKNRKSYAQTQPGTGKKKGQIKTRSPMHSPMLKGSKE